MIKINLLPVKTSQKKELLKIQLVLGGIVVFFSLSVCVFLFYSMSDKISRKQQEIDEVQGKILALKKTLGEVNKFEAQQKELEGKLAVLKSLKEAKSGPVHLLDELSIALPDKLWLTSYKETGGGILISGFGVSEDDVANFLQNLEASPYYKNVELKVIELSGKEGIRLHKFDATCTVESPKQKVGS